MCIVLQLRWASQNTTRCHLNCTVLNKYADNKIQVWYASQHGCGLGCHIETKAEDSNTMDLWTTKWWWEFKQSDCLQTLNVLQLVWAAKQWCLQGGRGHQNSWPPHCPPWPTDETQSFKSFYNHKFIEVWYLIYILSRFYFIISQLDQASTNTFSSFQVVDTWRGPIK